MTEYEKLCESDKELRKINEEEKKKLFKKNIIDATQLKNTQKGKPIPVLKFGPYFQNTSKEVRKLEKQKEKEAKNVQKEASKRREVREKEIQKKYPKEYHEHILQNMKEQFKEIEKSHDKDHER